MGTPANKGKPMSAQQRAKLKAQWTPERRRQASEEARRRQSGSPPSKNSGDSSASLPPSLPPTARAAAPEEESRVESLLEKLLSRTTTEEKAEKKTAIRELPDEDADREAALKPARFPARVPVIAFDETFKSFGLAELSPQEREEGVNAFSVLFWQWGLYRDGRVLVVLWLFAVMVPRMATAVRKRWFEKKANATLPPPTTQPRSE